jgi:hypothetical protein
VHAKSAPTRRESANCQSAAEHKPASSIAFDN